MNALVIYDTQYGNTRQVAQAIADALGEQMQVRLIPGDEAGKLDLQAVDLIAVGCPTHGRGVTPAIESLFEKIADNTLQGTAAIAFDTRLHWPGWLSGMASSRIAKHLQRIGCRLLLPQESFFVAGGEGPLMEGELGRAATWARLALVRMSSRETAQSKA